MPGLVRIIVSLAIAAVLVSLMLVYQVKEGESAVLTRFGKPVRETTSSGIYWRWPWPIDNVERLDARLEFYDVRVSETLTKDKRNVIIPVFAAWRIEDPLLYVRAVGNREIARRQLESLVTSAKNSVLASIDFEELVSVKEDELRIRELEEKIQASVNSEAKKSLGIAVPQIGMTRIALPEANTGSVFERMRAERAQFAARYRAEGQREADGIRADADAERTITIAKAENYARQIQGQAEAVAAGIYSSAYSQDAELYRFLREMEALRKMAGRQSVLMLDTSVPPFSRLKEILEIDPSRIDREELESIELPKLEALLEELSEERQTGDLEEEDGMSRQTDEPLPGAQEIEPLPAIQGEPGGAGNLFDD